MANKGENKGTGGKQPGGFENPDLGKNAGFENPDLEKQKKGTGTGLPHEEGSDEHKRQPSGGGVGGEQPRRDRDIGQPDPTKKV